MGFCGRLGIRDLAMLKTMAPESAFWFLKGNGGPLVCLCLLYTYATALQRDPLLP